MLPTTVAALTSIGPEKASGRTLPAALFEADAEADEDEADEEVLQRP